MNLRPAIVCAVVGAAAVALLVGPESPVAASGKAQPASGRSGQWQSASRVAGSHVAPATPAVAPRPETPRLDARLNRTAARTSGTAEVVLHGDPRQLATAVKAAKGRTLAAVSDAATVVVPAKSLRSLAGSPGVQSVTPPVRARALDNSEGVHLTNADAWQAAGLDGSNQGVGVKIGIVDVGFANLAAEVSAGHLPAGLTVAGTFCPDVNATDHGTAVTEIVHQMAPGAQLFLYCIDDDTSFAQAEVELQAAGVKVVNSSLSFPGDGRGDGNVGVQPQSSSATVRTARQNGILWIQSAGNSADDHWPGTFVDANHDTAVDLLDSSSTGQDDFIGIDSGGGAIELQWDKWPTSTLPVTLHAWQFDDTGFVGLPIAITHASGTAPVDCLEYPVVQGDGCAALPGPGSYDVWITVPTAALGVRYDLFYAGDVSFNYLSCGSWSSDGLTCLGPSARAQSGSVTEPATSPYALAVGAVDARPGVSGCQVDQNIGAPYPLEEFSSQGPTIDGRTKPDIASFDNVSGNVADINPFCGTSAAAPHVAGAAALVAAANPNMDAAQIQDFLERRAGVSPPNDQIGHGVLTMGDPSGITPPAGSGYTPLASPTRILDTRTTVGGHHAQLGPGQTATVTVPNLPADATAVAINLTGTSVKQTTFLASYPGGSPWPGTSNVNLTTVDSTAAVFAAVTLGPSDTITVRNQAGSVDAIVDLLGYYAPSAAGKYGAVGPTRIVDTRRGLGGFTGLLGTGQAVRYQLPSGSGVPADATSIIVNVTASNEARTGYLAVSPDCSSGTSTVNYLRPGYTRANLSITGLSADQGFCVYNGGGSAAAIVDLVGYVGPSGTARYVPLTSPTRIADTRTGNGGRNGALTAHTTLTLPDAGIFDVPASAKAMLVGVVGTNPTASTYLEVFPGTTPPASPTSSLNLTAGRVVSNAAVAGLTNGTFGIYNDQGVVQTVVDLFGYFV